MASVCDPIETDALPPDSMLDTPETATAVDDLQPPRHGARRWVCRLALAVAVAALLLRAWNVHAHAMLAHGDWTIQRADDVTRWLRGIAWRELLAFVSLVAVGVLVPLAFDRERFKPERDSRWTLRFAWLLGGAALIVITTWIAWGERPRLAALFVPFVGYLIGLRLGAACLRGARALLWVSAQLACLFVLLATAGIFASEMAIVDHPLAFDPIRLTDGDKHRLAEWIRDTKPPEGQPRQLRLTDSEIDSLLNAALGRGLADRKARVQSTPEEFLAEASIVLPERWAQHKYLNVQVAGQLAVDDGHLHLDCETLRVGRLSVPRVFLAVASPIAKALLLDDPQVRAIVGSIQKLESQDGAINTVFRPGALSKRVVPSLAQMIWERPDVAPQTEIYLKHLIATFDTLSPDSDRFGELLQAAFTLAAKRSIDHDPVLENRAAIFALAILIGHHDIEPFVGELLDPALRARADKMVDVVMLRGRTDWPRHFLVSSALALLSNESASDRVGLLKERLDAQDGGSGFSFGDLLADRSGTRFAIAATRDEASARNMQARLAGGFEVSEFFPPADGLPEGIPDAEFSSQYGGVDGAGYRSLSDEINQRLARLPAM